jgi:RES domain
VNLGACVGLRTSPEVQVWYGAINLRYIKTPLSTVHTKSIVSRFSPGYLASAADQFEVLYLAEDFQTALYEHGAMLGTPFFPGQNIPNPKFTPVVLNVNVTLQNVADLVNPPSHSLLGTTVQELTGDWAGYQARKAGLTPISTSIGLAPTQELGQALYKLGFEGFRTISAKASTHRTLVVFPAKMIRGSRIEFFSPDPIVAPYRIEPPP